MKDKSNTSLKTWIVLIAVFSLGCITGIGVDGIYRSKTNASYRESHSRDREALFEKIRSDLNLTEQQAKDMHQVLDESASEFRALRSELRPKYEEIRVQTRGRMRALLNAQQQQKFDALISEIDAHRQKGEGDNR
jgi:hypothetical protein